MHQKVPHARLWGIGATLVGVGSLLIGFRGPAPGWFAVLLSNMIILPGWMLLKFGIVLASGRRPPWRFGWGVCALYLGGIAWFALGDPSLRARVALFSFTGVLLDLVAIRACFTCADKALAKTLRIIGLFIALHDVSMLWRGFGALSAPLPSIFTADLAQVQFYPLSCIACTALTGLLILLTSEKYKHELFTQSRRDSLTGAANRRALDEVVAKEWPRAVRHRHPVACLMFDLDNFKAFNDAYGHRAGDAALQRVSACACGLLRQEDTWCRLGGEEFAALLPETSLEQAVAIAERIRQGVAALRAPCAAGNNGLSVSVGAAGCVPPARSWDELMEQADRALYRAKQAGRNRVVAAAPTAPPGV